MRRKGPGAHGNSTWAAGPGKHGISIIPESAAPLFRPAHVFNLRRPFHSLLHHRCVSALTGVRYNEANLTFRETAHLGWWISFQKMGGADISGDNTDDIMGNSRARGEPSRASSPQRPICSRRIPYIPAAVPAQWLRLLIFGNPDITATSPAGGDYHSQQGRHTGRETVVADNTLTIKQKSTLPVSKTRQDKSLFCSLSDTYLPPAM